MSQSYARPLDNNELTHHFLLSVLGLKRSRQTDDLVVRIVETEVLLATYARSNTLNSTKYRHPSYKSDADREDLRESIFEELISLARLPDDDQIGPGIGGLAPPEHITAMQARQAFILLGLPASGKSSIANRVADENGAFVVDSDYAKRKFPEFGYSGGQGAALVHEEAQLVTFGVQGESNVNVLEFCVAQGHNIVIPKIGSKADSIRTLREDLIEKGYEVHLTLVKADRICSVRRALDRFQRTGRYVPLALIFDGYGNDPILSYYYIRGDKAWASTGMLSTEGASPVVLEATTGNPANLYGGDSDGK